MYNASNQDASGAAPQGEPTAESSDEEVTDVDFEEVK